MIAHVRNGKIVALYGDSQHPLNKGALCAKGSSALQFEYDGDRILYPLIRVGERGEGKWRRVSWEEALDYVAKRLKEIERKYGPESIACHTGCECEESVYLDRRFWDAAGWPNFFNGWGLCYASQCVAQIYTFGSPLMEHTDTSDYWDKTKLFIIWDAKIPEGQPAYIGAVPRRILDGAKCIVIDPQLTPIATRADVWVPIRPNTDLAFALAMINTIINEELYDKKFVEKWTVGFDKLKEHVQKYTPEWAEKITDVPAETIKEVARMYATNKPAYICYGWCCHHTQYFQFARAYCTLMAITGNVEIYGGHMLSRVRSPVIDDGTLTFDSRLGLHNMRKIPEVAKQFPVLYEPFKTFTALAHGLMSLLRQGKIKALFVDAMNMPYRTPTYDKYIRAIDNVDFIVVFDVYMSEVAKYADVVLPSKTFLERDCPSLNLWHKHGILYMRQKTLDPPGECKSNIELFTLLAKKMGLDNRFPWKDEEELFNWLLEPAGVKFENLKNEGYVQVQERYPEKLYEKKGFATPSKKIEIYCSILEQMGADPLPTWHEELLIKPDEKYPYILSSYTPVRQHSWSLWKAVRDLEEILEQDHAYIPEEIAKEKGIKTGDSVLIETKHGTARYKAVVRKYMHPKTILVSRGNFEQAKIIDVHEPIDPVTSFIAERGITCNIRRYS
jgi:anaerobic selenocysteine-containing dehydrogenase